MFFVGTTNNLTWPRACVPLRVVVFSNDDRELLVTGEGLHSLLDLLERLDVARRDGTANNGFSDAERVNVKTASQHFENRADSVRAAKP